MTREEAITILNMVEAHGSLVIQAKDMAIKALEQEPCEDAISRQALLDDFGISEKTRKWGGDHSGYNTMMLYEIQDVIESQPLVKPQEPKTGHWIYDYTSADGHKTYHCSECGCYLQPKHSEPLNSFKWCSSCGVRMIEE